MLKDYYKILGLLDGAEEVVIRAAWKALAQRYHPDKDTDDPKKTNERMAEINAAYSVLSDPVKRIEYDSQRKNSNFQMNDVETDEILLSSVDLDWIVSTEYYPDLKILAEKISKISPSLEYVFKVTLLENKKFKDAAVVMMQLEDQYLRRYFGNNNSVLRFARELLLKKRFKAASDLNNAINVLGPDLDAHLVLDKICEKYQLTLDASSEKKWQETRNLCERIVNGQKPVLDIYELFQILGVATEEKGIFFIDIIVKFRGKTKQFEVEGLIEFGRKIAKNILVVQSTDCLIDL